MVLSGVRGLVIETKVIPPSSPEGGVPSTWYLMRTPLFFLW